MDGVSKTYAMTGWRIGWAVWPRKAVEAMAALQSHSTSNPTSIAQKAALAALTASQECVTAMKQEFEGRRNLMLCQLLRIKGVRCKEPSGAFYVFPNFSAFLKREKDPELKNAGST